MNTIYAYTTETYAKNDWLKVGQTALSADERISQQDGTSSPEPLLKVAEWKVPSSVTDKKLHSRFEELGVLRTRTDKSREWFSGITVDFVAETINELVHGVRRKNDFSPRDEQQECIDQASEYLLTSGDEFLVNAKMRFGKTFVSYKIAEKLNAKTVLVLTYKPAVQSGWKEDLLSHVDFDGWAFNSGKGFALDSEANVNVLFASFQDINDFDKSKWNGITEQHFDLVVIDEMHYGSDTQRAKLTLKNIKAAKTLFVSGTPLDAIISGRFTDEQIFTWSYTDEQAKRQQELDSGWATETYRWLPPMEFHTFEVSEAAKRNVAAYSDDEQFTMTKMFGSEDGVSFIDEASVKLFLDQVFGRGVRKSQSPFRTCAADHSLWVMPPSVNSVNAMCNLLEKMVGSEYKIVNVAGENINSLKKVKELIAHNTKTITVTAGRFNTGVTVPEWDAVLMLNDGRSAATYLQTVFRTQSPDKSRGKERCFVFDFNPERLMEVVYTYAELTAKKGQSIAANVRSFLEFAPIIDHSENVLKSIDADNVVGFVSNSANYLDKFSSTYLFNTSAAVSNTWLLDTNLSGVTNVKKQEQITTNNLVVGKNYVSGGVSAPKTAAQKKLEEQILEVAKSVTLTIPAYIDFCDPSVQCVSDLLETDPTLFQDEFKISLDMFSEMVHNGFIKEERLNRLIAGV